MPNGKLGKTRGLRESALCRGKATLRVCVCIYIYIGVFEYVDVFGVVITFGFTSPEHNYITILFTLKMNVFRPFPSHFLEIDC